MNMSQNHSEQFYTALQSNPSVKIQSNQIESTTLRINYQGQALDLVDYRPMHNTKGFNFSGLTFLKGANHDNKIECCRKGSPSLEQLRSYHLPSIKIDMIQGKPTISSSDHSAEKQELRQKLSKMAFGKGTVELIKVQWPHGQEIQVSYSPTHEAWILSDSQRTTLLPYSHSELKQDQENFLKSVVLFWKDQLSKLKDPQLLKQMLSRFTFCGKISLDWRKVCWYSVSETKNHQLICEDLFDAKNLVEKAGFRFARIKTISIVNNQDQMIRALQKLIVNVQSSFCLGRDNKYGRCKVYLVSNSKKQVLGGFEIFTLEDSLLNLMKELGSCELSPQQKISYFEQICLLFRSKDVRFPFPFQHYLELNKKIAIFCARCGVTRDMIEKEWSWILKCVLYLENKKIDIESFSTYFFQNHQLKEHLAQYSLEQLGPINCPITTIYCLVNPNQNIRGIIAQSLKISFKQLQLHFQIVPQTNQLDLSINHIIEFITSKPIQTLNHFFIDAVPRLFQLKCLVRQLHLHSREECHYQLRIITEHQDDFVNIDDNIYPFSTASVVNAYQEALNRQQNASKLAEKAQQMTKITEIIENLKNEDFKAEEKPIMINLISNSQERKEIKSAIESIFRQKRGSFNPYYVLIIELGKRKIVPNYDIESITTHIIADTYNKVKSFSFQT